MGDLMLSVSGCRGVVGESLTPEVAARFAGTFGSVVRERAGPGATVVVGRDGQAGGEVISHAAIAGLAGAGCAVVDLGVATTPGVAVMTDEMARRAGRAAGIVLTASHNPQEWNGLKCLLGEHAEFGSGACAPAPALAREIIERFKSAAPAWRRWDGLGAITRDDSACTVHVDRVMRAMEDAGLCEIAGRVGEGFRVALDSVNGAGAAAGRMLLESLGVGEVLHIGADRTGVFPHPPEPTRENLTLAGGLCDAVREGRCAVGFAQDPDADRLAIIDERGEYIGEEYTLALSALALLEGMKKAGAKLAGRTLVTNLSTSRMLDDVAARFGVVVLRTPVGEANVVETMKREGAVAGGEGNGGTIWPRVTYVRDSLSTIALVMWLLKTGGRKVSELVRSVPAYAIEKRKVSLARREDADAAIEKIAGVFAKERVDRRDGAWVDLASRRSWLHVRASNTEPIMRLIAEAPTSAEASRLLDEAARVIA